MLSLSVLTPSRLYFSSDKVESISLPSADGQLGILRRHCPLITAFQSGYLTALLSDRTKETFNLTSRFVRIQKDFVQILCASTSKA